VAGREAPPIGLAVLQEEAFPPHYRRVTGMGKIVAVLASVALAVGLIFVGSYAGTTDSMSKAQAQTAQPNIVFILTDDQAKSTLKYMPVVQRRLKGTGMTFENTINSYPLCCPARATLQRGQYTHNHRVLTNDPPHGGYERFDELNLEHSTVATWLKWAGYRTGYFGKYMNGYETSRILPDWDRWYVKAGPPRFGTINNQGTIIHVDTYQDAAFKSAAVRWVKRTAAPSRTPFFLMLATNAPHRPSLHDERYDSWFTDVRVPRTPAYNEADTSDKSEWIRQLAPLSEQEQEEYDSIYRDQLRSLKTVDAAIGSIIQTLKDEGELENTYIMYYTDNGIHHGEHRLRYGKVTPYRTDTRFPIIIRGPGVSPSTKSTALVSSNDIAPTLARMGGAGVPSFVDGRSLLPVADGDPPASWRTALLSYHWRWDAPLKPGQKPEWWALMTERQTYVEYETGEKEFYRLDTDPYEVQNAYDDLSPEQKLILHNRLEAIKRCSRSSCDTAEDGG
jgi:N-acetylglucosamine-6-sulfatase